MSTPLATRPSTEAEASATPTPPVPWDRWGPTLVRSAIILGLLTIWEALARTGVVNPVFAPPPTQVLVATVEILGDPRVPRAFSVTASEVGAAFLIALAFGLAVGMLLGLVRPLRDAYLGPIQFLLSTPKSIFLPIFLLLFGLGTTSKIAFGAFSAFFYIVTNVIGGVGLMQARHRQLAIAFRAPLHHYLLDIVMPAALPGIFTALWFGIRQSIIGVLIGELFASDAGIGYLIKVYTNQFRTDRTLAVVMLLSFAAIVAGTLWTRVESRLSRWRADART